jgi:hypothetical protein
MKYTITIAVSSALVGLVGCAAPRQVAISEPVGPAPTVVGQHTGGSMLQVYTARVRAPVDLNREVFMENSDFGGNDLLYEPAHTDYTICSQDGKVLEHVRNARSLEDPEPAIVPLAPGTYKIQARARDYGMVTLPVVIQPGRLTSVNLQRFRNPVGDSVPKTELVLLGNHRVIGWKATATTPAEHPSIPTTIVH